MEKIENNALIIGGVPKSGTTSLFDWLAEHPAMSPSILKETRFFLDEDYPLSSPKRFNGHNLSEYLSMFVDEEVENRVLLEATPDYLYSKSAIQIADLIPNSKMVFILRDQVSRMLSWYKFSVQRGFINESVGFDEYVMSQIDKPIMKDTPIHLRALEQGRYIKYLTYFEAAFGKRILVINFSDIVERPQQVMRELCLFANIDPDFYEGYAFQAKNVTQRVSNPRLGLIYGKLRRAIAEAMLPFPKVARVLSKPNQLLKRIMLGKTSKNDKKIVVSDELAVLIHEHTSRS